jgi:hypothetical protein
MQNLKDKDLWEDYLTEMLKLKVCISFEEIYSIIINDSSELFEKIKELLKLDKEESELLNSIKLVDLDLKKIGRRLHEIRTEAGR